MSYSEKRCKVCDTVFTPGSSRRSTCSDGCKNTLRKQWNNANDALAADIKREENHKKYINVSDIPTCVVVNYCTT